MTPEEKESAIRGVTLFFKATAEGQLGSEYQQEIVEWLKLQGFTDYKQAAVYYVDSQEGDRHITEYIATKLRPGESIEAAYRRDIAECSLN